MLENTFGPIALQAKILTWMNMIEPSTSHPFFHRKPTSPHIPHCTTYCQIRRCVPILIQLCMTWFRRTSCYLNKSQFILPSTKSISSPLIIKRRHINVACFRSNDMLDNLGSLCLLFPYSFLSSHPLLFNSTNFDTSVLHSLFLISTCLISNKKLNRFTVFDKLTSI